MSRPGFEPTLDSTETPELEFGALIRSAMTPHGKASCPHSADQAHQSTWSLGRNMPLEDLTWYYRHDIPPSLI